MALNSDDIKQLISILQRGLEDDDGSDDAKPSRNASKSKTKNKKHDEENLFETMPEARMHKDDVEIDKKLNRAPPTQRSRSFQPITVTCRVCGKKESVNPVLVESVDRYKCNKCAISAG